MNSIQGIKAFIKRLTDFREIIEFFVWSCVFYCDFIVTGIFDHDNMLVK